VNNRPFTVILYLQKTMQQLPPPIPPTPPVPPVLPVPLPIIVLPNFGLPAEGALQGGPYHIFYDDPTKDSFNGLYQSALEEFRVPLQGNPGNTPAELANKVYDIAYQGFPAAFLVLTRDATAPLADPGQITCYHRVTTFRLHMGLPATPFDNVAFAFLGDLVLHQAPPSIIWEGNNFHVLNHQVCVPTMLMMDQFLAAAPDDPMLLGPYIDDDAGTEIVRTRRTMPPPPNTSRYS
jgi:hypothetical protein